MNKIANDTAEWGPRGACAFTLKFKHALGGSCAGRDGPELTMIKLARPMMAIITRIAPQPNRQIHQAAAA